MDPMNLEAQQEKGHQDIAAQLERETTLQGITRRIKNALLQKTEGLTPTLIALHLERGLALPIVEEERHMQTTLIRNNAFLNWTEALSTLLLVKPEKAPVYQDRLLTMLDAAMKNLEVPESGFKKFDAYDQQVRLLYKVLVTLPKGYESLLQERLNSLSEKLYQDKEELTVFLKTWSEESDANVLRTLEPAAIALANYKLKNQIDILKGLQKGEEIAAPQLEDFKDMFKASALRKASDGAWVFDHGGKEWRFSAVSMDSDFYYIFSQGEDGLRVLGVMGSKLLEHAEAGTLGQLAEQAEQNYTSEQEGQTVLEQFDLPKDKPMAHFAVLPRTFHSSGFGEDPVVSLLFPSMILSQVLQERYGLTAYPPVFTDSPAADIQKQVQTAYDKGARHMVIDILSHGEPGKLVFEQPMSGAELVALAKQFPDCSFTINTSACFGGGLIEPLRKTTDPSIFGRLTVFTQTKPDVINMPAIRPAGNDSTLLNFGGTNYYLELIRGLMDKEGYGNAVHRADVHGKSFGTDAEGIVDGTYISKGLVEHWEA